MTILQSIRLRLGRTQENAMTKVLFVCMGNICRSPTAQGIFTELLQREGLSGQVQVDSAGTHAYHVGDAPDERACLAAGKRGIDLRILRARRVHVRDFEKFDYVLVMDRINYRDLQELCPPEHTHKVRLLMEFAPHLKQADVPDPYYGGLSGFERVIDMVEEAARGLLEEIRRREGWIKA